MAYTTLEARLTKIRDAIDDIVAGRVRRVTIGDVDYTLHDLEVLEAMERRLEARVARAPTNGRMLVVPRRAGNV